MIFPEEEDIYRLTAKVDKQHGTSTYDLAWDLLLPYDFDAVYAYAEALKLLHKSNYISKKYNVSANEIRKYSLVNAINSAMHIAHEEYENIRRFAIEKIAHEYNIKKEKLYCDYKKRLFGGDMFPPELRILIEKATNFIKDDISINYCVTWHYSHLDFPDMDDWESESPYIEITGFSKEVVKMAIEAVYKLPFIVKNK